MWILLSLLGFIIFLIWCLSSPFYWRKRNVPHLLPIPLLGSFYRYLFYGFTDLCKNFYNNFPDSKFYGIYFFTRPTLFIKDPELLHKILITDFEFFTSHALYGNEIRDPTCGNLFHIHGQQWKEMRKKLTALFTPFRIKAMLKQIDEPIYKAMCRIDQNIVENKPTEIHEIVVNVTADVLTQSIFGYETYTQSEKQLVDYGVGLYDPLMMTKLFVGLLSTKVYDLLKLNVLNNKETDKVMDIVRKTIEFRKKRKVKVQDCLQGMMDLADNYDPNTERKYFPDNTAVPRYELEALIHQEVILYAAGLKPTSLVMTHLLYELATNPRVQEKCRNEIVTIAEESGGDINVNDLAKLVYLGAVIQETLRKHSPIILEIRECTKNYKIPDTEVIIEKGTLTLMTPIGAHMDPKYFPEPEVFKPERFLDGSKIVTGSYFPFGLGPRACIGMGFANKIIKLIISKFLLNYEFSVCTKTDIPIKRNKYDIFTSPADGIWLVVNPIVNKN